MRNRYFVLANAVCFVSLFAASGLAHSTPPPPPLNFENNYFVTGDYVVGGVGLQGKGINDYATGTITIPDANPGISGATSVPAGAQIVAALLYWETVESSPTTFQGQQGFFRPVFAGGPSSGYPISGAVLGNPNAPTPWGLGGCAVPFPGSKTLRSYRADVLAFLPQDAKGNVLANGSYEVRLADSGGDDPDDAPSTLGATLVIIYRVLSQSLPPATFPLNSVIIYDGAFAPSIPWPIMSQRMQGFYQAAAAPVTRLTHIVGNGQPYKYETVFLNKTALPSLYGKQPAFPGYYKGAWGQGVWDNPTWSFPNPNYPPAVGNPVKANDAAATTSVVPGLLGGCVSHGAVILSTTVQNTDNDGILDVWKTNHGYCDAAVNEGVCASGDPSWVDLSGATPGKRDVFVQFDYLCSSVSGGVCSTAPGNYSFSPPPDALTMLSSAFSPHNINLHLVPGNAIQEQTCADTPGQLCAYPSQPGVVGWKRGFVFLKNQPLNYPDEASCLAATNPPCQRRFQHGRKDSYHYAIFGHALGAPNWSLQDGSLTSVVASGNTVTFTTSTPHGLVANDPLHGNGRVTVSDAISNPNLKGTYLVQTVPDAKTFTITIVNAANAAYTQSTDPNLSVASGQAGTSSGMSDVGGEDSLITLGLWPTGQTTPVQAGTFMHELGHTLGLTHGGFFFDQLQANPNDYTPTVEANCKPNFQSVMNYLFQVDLLDNGVSNVPDYSGPALNPLDESNPSSPNVLAGAPYLTTRWYAPNQPVGSPATHYCDGRPLPVPPPPNMFRLQGVPASIAWAAGQDINFDGKIQGLPPGLRGYNDWANIDLRQIGATGSESTGGTPFSGGGTPFSGGGTPFSGGGTPFSGGGTPFSGGGVGNTEITFEAANSVVRPPSKLTATLTGSTVVLNWTAPTFSQVAAYNIYRGVNGATPTFYKQIPPPVFPATPTFTDLNVGCAFYAYFVTAVLADNRESVPSNTTPSVLVPCIFTGFLKPLTTAGDSSYSGAFEDDVIPIVWQIANANPDVSVNNVALKQYFTLLPKNKVCPLPSTASGNYTLLYSSAGVAPSKVPPSNTFTYDANNKQFVFKWNSEGFNTGCYIIELDLRDGQVKRTSLRLFER